MKDLQIKKLYYSISEVARMVDLEQYVLRYWESEFEQLRPQKNRAGNRIYTEREIALVRLIKRLTREERYTIDGARQVMAAMIQEHGGLDGALDAAADQGGTPNADTPNEAFRSRLLSLRATLHRLREQLVGAQNEGVISSMAQHRQAASMP